MTLWHTLRVVCLVQADEYRHAGDNYQLYTMLMRFARYVQSPGY